MEITTFKTSSLCVGNADDLRMLMSGRGVPLIFQIMVSQGAHLMSSAGDDQSVNAIAGDYITGRARVLIFLNSLRQRNLFEPTRLDPAITQMRLLLNEPWPIPQYAVLQLDESMDATQMQELLSEILDVDILIDRYLSQWTAMAIEQTEDMWNQLGFGKETQTAPPPVTESMRSTSAIRQYQAIQRPGLVTAVCVLQIVAGIIVLAGGGLMVAQALSTTGIRWPGFLVFMMILTPLLIIAEIVLVFFVLNGSFIARNIYAIVVVISLAAGVVYMIVGGTVSTLMSMVFSVAYLRVLYSPSSNAYFDSHRR